MIPDFCDVIAPFHMPAAAPGGSDSDFFWPASSTIWPASSTI